MVLGGVPLQPLAAGVEHGLRDQPVAVLVIDHVLGDAGRRGGGTRALLVDVGRMVADILAGQPLVIS